MTITIGNSQGIPMGKYTPSTGGGGGGGGTTVVTTAEKYGVQGDYATHYGILDCPNGLITYSLGKDIIIEPGIVLQAAGSDTKTTIASAINYTIVEDTDVTLFYAEGTILEAGAVYYQTEEPTDGDVGYLAWFNPEIMQWQFKSDDTGNVWRTAVATPIANVRIVDGNITRLDYMGYRILDDDIIAHKQDIDELEALLDEKQDLLNTTDPIRIGTTIIGEPNNISVLSDKITPQSTKRQDVIVNTSNSTLQLKFLDGASSSLSFDENLKTCAYFDIPLSFSNYFINDYSAPQTIRLTIEGMTSISASNFVTFYAGQLSSEGFKPYLVSRVNAMETGTSTSSGNVSAILTGLVTPQFSSSSYWTVPYSVVDTSSSNVGDSSGRRAVGFLISKASSGKLQCMGFRYNGSYYKTTSVLSSGNADWDLAALQNCNTIRVVMYLSGSSNAFYPNASLTRLEYRGIGDAAYNTLDWNIESGIVTTYGIALKYDNQTLQVNSNGELTVNLDELGNEVNAISGRVTTLETNMGGLKLQKITEADYEALTLAGTVDENTMYLIVDDTTA